MITSEEKRIRVCLTVDSTMKEDFRLAYCRYNPLYRLFYTILGVVLLRLIILNPQKQPWYFMLPLLCFAVCMFFFAFGMLQAWWRWAYWPGIQKHLGPDNPVWLQISADGIHWETGSRFHHFRSFQGLKESDRAVLLYFDKADAMPFHRNQFQTEEDWQFLRQSAQKHSRPLLQLLTKY